MMIKRGLWVAEFEAPESKSDNGRRWIVVVKRYFLLIGRSKLDLNKWFARKTKVLAIFLKKILFSLIESHANESWLR